MGKTIEELFKTKVLADGKTAEQKYDIRNSKDLPISANTTVLLQPSFRVATALRRKISTTKGETRLEEETSGLRIINTLSAPLIYGTDIFKFQKKSTRLVEIMKDSVNSNNPQDAGIVGNFLKKAENFGLKVAGKLGIAFPESTIPTKISLNSDFKSGKEPDTMITLAKIKNDSRGNLIGQVLKNSARGTPKQIGNQLLGTGINLLKGEIKKKLFGAPKQGAQNLAKKGETEVQYDSSAKYSDTVNPTDEDVYKRNDLSSIQFEKLNGKKQAQANSVNKFLEDSKSKISLKSLPAPTPNLGGKLNLDTSRFNIGGKISSIKDSVASKLTSARKEGQTLIANSKLKIGDINPAVPSEQPAPPINYSSTIDAKSDDIKLRNDLSSKLDALTGANDEAKSKGATVTPTGAPEAPVDASALSKKLPVKNPFASISEKLDSTKKEATAKLEQGRKEGQQRLAGKDDKAIAAGVESKNDGKTKYSDTVDETQDDVALRNDLSSKLQALSGAISTLNTSGTSATREAVGISTYSSLKDGQTPKVTLKTKYGIDSNEKSDFVNENTQYKGDSLKVGDSTLDDYDFITLKFTSINKGESVNFRATLSGITETTTPTWDSAKFIGSPFPYWTYTGIERSVSFNFKVYSTTPLQHIAAWQRLNFLTSLAYPQAYNKGIAVIAPFLKITIGNLYKNQPCFISQLSYTVDDNGTWEVGPTAGMGMADNETFTINGESTTLDNYKLPKVIDVSVTLNLVESKSSTQSGYLYGFDKFPKVPKASSQTTGKSAEVASDANTKNSVSQTEATINTSAPKETTVNATAKVNNPGETKTISNPIGTDAKKVEEAKGGTKIEEGAKPKTPTPADDPVKGKFAKTFITKSPPQSTILIYTRPNTRRPGQFIAAAYLNGKEFATATGPICNTNEAAVKYLEEQELKSL